MKDETKSLLYSLFFFALQYIHFILLTFVVFVFYSCLLKLLHRVLSITIVKLKKVLCISFQFFDILFDAPCSLSFVDLAGSERYTKTQNSGERLKEAANINTSLMTLGKCVEQLKYNQSHRLGCVLKDRLFCLGDVAAFLYM